jgi:hypothetical protein
MTCFRLRSSWRKPLAEDNGSPLFKALAFDAVFASANHESIVVVSV